MELVLSPGRIGGENNTGSPFQNQEVREWSHVDRLTGMLEHARIETGRWQTRHQGTAQAYGKVIDSRERNSADGNVVQKARRQVEVFQSQGIGGRSVQVVRASQWSSSRITDSTSSSPSSVSTNDVPQLRNPTEELMRNTDESLTKLSQVSRLCRQIQNGDSNDKMGSRSPLLGNKFNKFDGNDLRKDSQQLMERKKLLTSNNNGITNNLKSNSNEDLTESIIDSNSKSQMIMFTRDSKVRRSLQIPKSAVVYSDFDIRNKINEIEIETKPPSSSSRNSPSSDTDLSVLKNDRKTVKSYVLGMEEADSESPLKLPKKITDKKILFNGTSVDETGRDSDIIKSEYLRPTPILLKPKCNTTVVHLNNKSHLDSRENCCDENQPISIGDKSDSASATVNSKSRVRSLASRFSNGNNNYKLTNAKDHGGAEAMNASQNLFSHNFSTATSSTSSSSASSSSSSSSSLGKKKLFIDSSSRIESLINRSTVVNGGENTVLEIFPSVLSEKKVAGGGDEWGNGKPVKKVGFCKTEVHFAAESGKVNIVETDCKPPPSNRFRRRRRINGIANNAGITNNKNLPLIHFGDTSYEKYIFGQSGSSNNVLTESMKNDNFIKKENDMTNSPAVTNESKAPIASGEGDLPLQNEKRAILEEKFVQLASDELIIRDGWRSRLKTIMQSEPPTIITDGNNDDDTDLINSEKNFHLIDETIIDHSFKGHTTMVNLGAGNVISKLKKHTNEGKCNSTLSTGIQLQFNTTRLESVQTGITSNSSNIPPCIGLKKINHVEKNRNIFNGDKNQAPYSIVVSTAVSRIPRPLIQAQQSVLKSAHLVMSINKINNFNSIVRSTADGSKNSSYLNSNNSIEGKNLDENSSLTLKGFLSSLKDNHNHCREMVIRERNSNTDIVNNNYPKNAATLITINANNRSMDYSENKSLTINGDNYNPPGFTPLRLKHVNNKSFNEPEERDKEMKKSLNDKCGDDNQLQYSSGSEQADEEVRSYMLGTRIQRSTYTHNKKCSDFISAAKMEEFITTNTKKSEDEHLISSTEKETRDNDDFIDLIDIEKSQRMIDENALENIVDSSLPDEEVCFEANRTVEKNHMVDKPLIMSESNVVTSDNENNKVLLSIVKTHEPVIARVEEISLPEIMKKRELIISGSKKLRTHNSAIATTIKQQLQEEEETILREAHATSNNKLTSSTINEKKRTTVKHKAKDHCDSNKTIKEVPKGSFVDDNKMVTADPTYVNVFENVKTRSVPIYENYRVTRKNNNNKDNNDNNNRTDKKHSKNIIRSELINEVPTNVTVAGNCETGTNLMSDPNHEGGENFKKLQYGKSRNSDVTKLADNISISKIKDNGENYSNKIKQSKTKSKKIVRRPSSTSSIEEGVHRNSCNETTKEISQTTAAGLHTKSTRSSRLHRAAKSGHETFGNEIIMERYISSNDDKKKNNMNSSEISSNKQKLPRSDRSAATIETISTKNKNDDGKKDANDSIRSKKPIEIVYQTAVFNMKNEKLAKSSKSKESKTTPRYINDLICGISKPKRTTDSRHVKGSSQSQQRVHLQKSASPTNRHWK